MQGSGYNFHLEAYIEMRLHSRLLQLSFEIVQTTLTHMILKISSLFFLSTVKHDYWDGNYGVSFDIVVVVLANVVPSILLLVKEYYSIMACACMPSCTGSENRRQNLPWRDANSNVNNFFVADESVNGERRRVENLTKHELSNDTAVVCQGLAKSFGKKNVILRIDLCVAK